MDIFPAPFTLGCSPVSGSSVVPVDLQLRTNGTPSCLVSCVINNVKYQNSPNIQTQDSNFATIIYNKLTKQIFVSHNPPQFLRPVTQDVEPAPARSTSIIDRAALTNAFGSARRQKLLRETERHSGSISAALDAAVIQRAMRGQHILKTESMASEIPTNSAPSKPADERVLLLPQFNMKASRPEDAYPFSHLIADRSLKSLRPEAQRLINAMESKSEPAACYRKCVLDRIRRAFITEKGDKTVLATRLCLLHHLLSLYELKSRMLERKNPLPDTPVPLSRQLLTNFTTQISQKASSRFKTRSMPTSLRDKLFYHVLVVILHCDNFKTCIDDLTVDFKMPSERLKRYFAYLGCKIVKETTFNDEMKGCLRSFAILQTPLRFPNFFLRKQL